MSAVRDLTGMRFGRLLVQCKAASDKSKQARFVCLCDCGASRIIRGSSLSNGLVKSCGCWRREASKARRTQKRAAVAARPRYQTQSAFDETFSANPLDLLRRLGFHVPESVVTPSDCDNAGQMETT